MRLVTSIISNISDTSDAGVRVPQHIMSNGASDSYVFKVHNEAAILTAYNLTEGDVVLHSVFPTDTGSLTTPILSNGTPIKLTPTNTRVVVPEEGTYQLATINANAEAIIALTYTKDYAMPISVASGSTPTPTPQPSLQRVAFRGLSANINTVPNYLVFDDVKSTMDASLGTFSTDLGYEGKWFYPQQASPSLYRITVCLSGIVDKVPFSQANMASYPSVTVGIFEHGTPLASLTRSVHINPMALAVGESVHAIGEFQVLVDTVVELTAGIDAIQIIPSSNTVEQGYGIVFTAEGSYLVIEAL